MAGILTDIFVWSLKIWKSTRSLILCAHLFLLRLSWPGVMPKQRETFQVNWTLLKNFNDAHCQTKKKKISQPKPEVPQTIVIPYHLKGY